MDHCAPSEFWELWNSDGLNSVCVNNKQAWFCTCLYKLVHSSFGTSKTPAYPFESKTVSFMFWLSFRWQFCKSNRFCALPSFLPSFLPCNDFDTSLSLVIGKLVESGYGNYPMTREDTEHVVRTLKICSQAHCLHMGHVKTKNLLSHSCFQNAKEKLLLTVVSSLVPYGHGPEAINWAGLPEEAGACTTILSFWVMSHAKLNT